MNDRTLEPYWREAASWDSDRMQQALRENRIAWASAGAGWLCALMSAAALALLIPLKRVDPFVVRVDNSTGTVDVVPVYAGQAPAGEAVTRYLLSHYVTVCERFNFPTAESDYQECGAFHSGARNQAWYALWNPANSASPLNLYKDGTTIRARVVSVSFFKRASGIGDLAQVRYVKGKRLAGAVDEQLTHWIATIQYGFGPPSTNPQTRNWNPLGFKVVDFQPEPEAAAEAISVPSGVVAAEGSRP